MDFRNDGGYSASIVFGIKRGNDNTHHRSERREAVKRFCTELAPLLPDDCLITWFPSSNPQKIDTGVRDLAKALSRTTGLPSAELLARTTRIPAAHLGGARSVEIHRQTLEMKNPGSIRGQHIVVIDDVTTSGSSLQAARQLLQQSGASHVTTIALGRTQGGHQITPCQLVRRDTGPDGHRDRDPWDSTGSQTPHRHDPIDDSDIPF